jgi:opacity protein-like surface antigen
MRAVSLRERKGSGSRRGESMKTILTSLLLLLFALPSHAQEAVAGPVTAGIAPVVEAGVGFTYVQGTVPSQGQVRLNGIEGVWNGDLQRHFGVKVDVGYSRLFDAFSTGHSADLLTYMAGPVFYPVRTRRMHVYTELLLGAARETGVNFENNGQLVMGYANEFAWAGGGGFQYRLTPSFSVRIGADYLRTAFFNSNVTVAGQTNLRSSVNLIYTFGEHE